MEGLTNIVELVSNVQCLQNLSFALLLEMIILELQSCKDPLEVEKCVAKNFMKLT